MTTRPNPRAAAARRNGALGGRPAGQPTKLVRIYAADAERIRGQSVACGCSAAEVVRAALDSQPPPQKRER